MRFSFLLLQRRPVRDPQEEAQIAAAYARDILEVLDSETLTPLEKNNRLRRVIREIKPVDGGFRIVAWPFRQVVHHDPPVTSIVMYVTGTEVRIEYRDAASLTERAA